MSAPHLASLQSGQAAVITTLNTSIGVQRRLRALGFRAGRQVTMLRRSWLAGPVHVRIGTTEVMMRLRDAQDIQITPVLNGEAS